MLKIPLLFFSLVWLATAQAQQLRPEVLASAGTSFNDPTNTVRLSFTLGESVILGQQLASFSYGQGFHNAAIQTVRVLDLDLAVWNIEMWPNPVAQQLFLRFTAPDETSFLNATIWNLLGQAVSSPIRLDATTEKTIPVTHLAAGVYLLRLATAKGQMTTLKFVKVDP